MDNSTTKILVVAVVAIVALAAIGYAFLGNSDNSDEGETSIGELPVYGNANKDMQIDGADKEIIQNIIDGKEGYTLAAYPYADANNDKVVDSKDLAVVDKIINGEKTTVFNVNYAEDGGKKVKTYVTETDWPATNAIVMNNMNAASMKIMGLEDKVVASNDKSGGWYDPGLLGYLGDDSIIAIDVWGSTSVIDQVSNVLDKKGDCLMVTTGGIVNGLDINEVEGLGCDVIQLCDNNPLINEVVSSILLLGFMFNDMDAGKDIAKLYWKVWNGTMDIAEKITGTKIKFANGMGTADNAYVYKGELAGGEFAFANTDAPINAWGTGYEFGDWVYTYQVDKLFSAAYCNAAAGTFFGGHENMNAQSYVDGVALYKDMECYQNGDVYMYYYGLPTLYDPLILGSVMYPELYGDFCDECVHELLVKMGDNPDGKAYADMDIKLVYSLEEMKNIAEQQKK